ncbi:hypothetical protein Tco_0567679 [Tanacetum coccineum]
MTTLAEFMIVAGADNRPPMLDKNMYNSWKSRMELYIEGKENDIIILNSVNNGPLIWPTVEENGVTRVKRYEELFVAKKLQADCDLKATNIIFQGLPPDVYSLVNHHRVAKDIWDRLKLLMQGTTLLKQERECKLYDEFDKFSYIKGKTLHQYYLRFAQLINDMNIYQMTMKQVQVNTKFLNSLLSEWSKFVINVKLARDLHTTNYDQLHAYLQQHEIHANEARLMRERYPDPFDLYSAPPPSNPYRVSHHQQYHNPINPQSHTQVNQLPPPSPPQSYPTPSVAQQPHAEFHQPESNLAVLSFQQREDPIDCINKAMAVLSVVASRFPSTNNQLRTSSNPRNQATIQDGEGHMARQCTQPKRRRDAVWFKEKTITHNATFQTDDLDVYDSDCDDISFAKAVLMENLSSCDSDVLSEVPYTETYQNDLINEVVQEMQYFEQPPIYDSLDNEITSDSNIND